MTREEQLNRRASITRYDENVINILAIWEEMDLATGPNAQVGQGGRGRVDALIELRGDIGTWELRDLAITLYPYIEAVYAELPERLSNDGYISYDWDFLSFIIRNLDWSSAEGSPITLDLVPAEDMAAQVEHNWPDRS